MASTISYRRPDGGTTPAYLAEPEPANRPAVPGPARVQELPAQLVDALVGVRAKVVALRPQQVGRHPRGAVAIVEGQRRREGRGGYPEADRADEGLAPARPVAVGRAGEELVEQQILEVRIGVEGIADDAPAAPGEGDARQGYPM